MPYDIFLSHASEDQGTADRIAEYLQNQGLTCWSKAAAGERVDPDAFAAMRDCLVVVLILSKAANHSVAAWQEVALAIQGKKRLIPFRTEDVPLSAKLEPLLRWISPQDAFPPPLEHHIEELLRVLRPLAAQRRSEIADEALLSRTLPSQVLAQSDPTRPRPRNANEPLSLTFNFDHPIIAGHPASFEILLQNVGLENLDDIEILLENRNLRRAITYQVPHLGVDKGNRTRLELEPIGSDQTILHVTVTCRASDRRLSFTASRSLRIYPSPTPQELPAGPIWFFEHLRRRVAFSPSLNLKFPTVPDLLKFRLPEYLEPLTLTFDHEILVEVATRAETSRELQILPHFLSRNSPGTKLVLEPIPSSADLPHQELRLVARPRFVLGRSPEEADYLLWFWPRGEAQDTKTRRLSKKHCALSLQDGKFSVSNLAAASLITLDGQDIPVPGDALLQHRGVINLSGIYFLEATHLAAHSAAQPNIANLSDWAGAKNPAEPPPASGAVRFVPLTPHVLPQQAIWLFDSATFGASKVNPLILEGEGVEEIQGRFHYHLGCFWVENLSDNGGLLVDGHAIAPGRIAPLAHGMTLRLGQKDYRAAISA